MAASPTAFLEAVLENLTEGVVACDADGVLTTFNRATREFHHLPEKPIPAEQWSESYSLFLSDGVTPMSKEEIPLFRALSGEVVKNVEMVIRSTQGSQRVVACNGQAIYDSFGKIHGAVVTMRDVTEIKNASVEIQTFNKQLEERVRARTEELQTTNEKLSQEIQVRERAEIALLASEKRFRTLFEQSPLSVQLLSVDGRTVQVNSAWKKLWGIPEEIIQNFILKDYNLLKDPQLAERGILPVIKNGFEGVGGKIPAIYYDTTVIDEGARGRWVEGYIEPIFTEAGEVREVVLIHQDVTEKVEFERALKAARDAAEEGSRLKSAFLANMSHEIRTPLSAILGYTDLLRSKSIQPEEAEEYLAIIDRSGKALTTIIDDILDLSKVEAGRLKIETMPVDLEELIRDVLALFKQQAKQKNISTIFESQVGSRNVIETDPIRLRQILINLVGNAMKFTSSGKIRTKVEVIPDTEEGHLKISVEDTGLGIALNKQSELFQPFSQIDNSRSRQFGGTGLGLVLSRRLAQAMGGDVFLEFSRPQEGSLFSVTLPLKQDTTDKKNMSRQNRPSTGVQKSLSGIRVLVTDDSEDNRVLLNRVLTRRGAIVAEAVNGADAVEKTMAGDFNLVLMDVQMPVMDGFEAIEHLRRSGYTKPIIALTAHAMAEERDRCLAAGANAHLSKPINFEELTTLIAKLSSS